MAAPTLTWILANLVNVKNYGAKGDGVTDDLAAIQAAINANPGKAIWFPYPGVYVHSNTINLVSAGFYSDGAILKRTDEDNGVISLSGTAPFVYGLVIAGCSTKRSSRDNAAGIGVNICTEFSIRYTTVYNVVCGIKMNPGCTNGYVAHNTVLFTWADGIHHTTANGVASPTGASNIITEYNYVYGTGDDCISVVSYANNGVSTACSNIIIRFNRVGYNYHARGITVIGGSNITVFGNNIRDCPGSGIHIAAEGGYDTVGVDNLSVTYNYIYNSGIYASGLGAIHIHGGGGWDGLQEILSTTITNNHIELPRYLGFRTTGTVKIVATFASNTCRTSGSLLQLTNSGTGTVITTTPSNTTYT